jgi:hypothetical protein
MAPLPAASLRQRPAFKSQPRARESRRISFVTGNIVEVREGENVMLLVVAGDHSFAYSARRLFSSEICASTRSMSSGIRFLFGLPRPGIPTLSCAMNLPLVRSLSCCVKNLSRARQARISPSRLPVCVNLLPPRFWTRVGSSQGHADYDVDLIYVRGSLEFRIIAHEPLEGILDAVASNILRQANYVRPALLKA